MFCNNSTCKSHDWSRGSIVIAVSARTVIVPLACTMVIVHACTVLLGHVFIMVIIRVYIYYIYDHGLVGMV